MDILFFRVHEHSASNFDAQPAIETAKRWNPGVTVSFIGDSHQPRGQGRFLNIAHYSESMQRLAPIFRHPAKEHEWWHWATLCQWLTAHDYARKHNVRELMVPDTDVLIFCNVDRQAAPFRHADYTTSMPHGAAQCPTYIFNPKVLEDFVVFVERLYQDTGEDAKLVDGGLNSMVLWDLFHHRHTYKRADTSEVIEGTTFCHNLGMDYHGYEFADGGRVLHWEKGQPYANTSKAGYTQRVRFNTLHCWGPWKQRMKELVHASRVTR